MHLWPSTTIRDSFKISYLSKLEWNLQRMNSEKKRQQSQTNNDQRQKLLSDNKRNGAAQVSEGSYSNNPSRFASIFGESFMLLSCCYCCGACTDQQE